MRRIKKYNQNKSMTVLQTVLSVHDVMKQVAADGKIPAAMNNRPYDYGVEVDENGHFKPKDFAGFGKDLHPDLLKTVSRENRLSVAERLRISQEQKPAAVPAGDEAPGVSVSPASAPAE